MKNSVFDKLLAFLEDLDQRQIPYTLAHHREDAVMIITAVPGERWEIEFLGDGSVEVERFVSDGMMYGEDILGELFARYSQPGSEPEEDGFESAHFESARMLGD